MTFDELLINKINVGVELIAEGELIYLVAGEDKEQKYDITPDAYAAVFRSMAAHAERLGGNCAIAFPGGVLQFKKRDRVMEAMKCKTCRYGIQDDGITLCTNKDRLWSESPEEVASYQVCRLWMQRRLSDGRAQS